MAFGKDIDPKVGAATAFKPGQSGNPNGKPKGTKHLSTWIQELLNDDDFVQLQFDDADRKWKEYKGAPLKAIIQAQMKLALKGDHKSFDLLGKYGFGVKQEIDVTTNGENVNAIADPTLLADFMDYMKNHTQR